MIAAQTPIIEAYFDESMVQFFKPGDVEDLTRCILTLYKDRSRLSQLAKNADRFNQSYSWASVAANYATLVERLSTS